MVNHKFPHPIQVKGDDLRVVYAAYFVLKRFNEILFGKEVIVDPKMFRAIQHHRDAIWLNPLLSKWVTYINSFSLQESKFDDPALPKVVEFINSHQLIKPIEIQVQSLFPQLTFPSEEWREGFEDDAVVCKPEMAKEEATTQAICTLCSPCTYQVDLDMEDKNLLKVIDQVISSIHYHQRTDHWCQRIITQLETTPGVELGWLDNFVLKDNVLYRKHEGLELLVLPSHVIPDVVRLIHNL